MHHRFWLCIVPLGHMKALHLRIRAALHGRLQVHNLILNIGSDQIATDAVASVRILLDTIDVLLHKIQRTLHVAQVH